MASFNNRVFGANIHPIIKNKLKARKIFAFGSQPNDSVQSAEKEGTLFTKLDDVGNEEPDTSATLYSAMGISEDNSKIFQTSDGKGIVGELSSKTPWVRMWTVVQLFYYVKGGFEDYKGQLYKDDWGNISATPDQGKYGHPAGEGTIKDYYIRDELQHSMEGRVYAIGNHIFNNETNLQDPSSPIFEGKQNSSKYGFEATDHLKTEMESNEFMKPPAGITSISSETEGSLGAIKRTTVKFVVHNFNDFENIYQKYFLRPGALVVIDFGWNTSKIYDPHKQVIESGITLRDTLFSDNGVVAQSKGDLECLIGYVVDYSAKVRTDGGFDCSVEVVSANDAILDREVSEQNNLRNKFVSGIAPVVINKAAHLIGKDFLRNDWSTSKDTLEESIQYANTFASTIFGSDSNSLFISADALKVGVYWQSLNEETKTIRGANNIFISWAFFEEEVLNSELELKHGEALEFGAKFDSSNSFITYDDNLKSRQNIHGGFSVDKTELKFLYPPSWDDKTTYFTINDVTNPKGKNYELPVRPDTIVAPISTSTRTGPQMTSGIETGEIETGNTKLDKDANRIPMRELFVNLKVIKDAFKSENNVNDAIKKILDVISEDSYDIFDLKLVAGHRDNSTLMVVDQNRTSVKSDTGEELFDYLFTFSPHSPDSIVKSMDLTYATPKNGLQNMIAIQNTDPNVPIFINSKNEEMNQSLRRINSLNDKQGIAIRYLPELKNDFSTKDGGWRKVKEDDVTVQDKSLLTERVDSGDLITQYKNLFDNSTIQGDSAKTLTEGYDALGNYELDLLKGFETPIEEDFDESTLNPEIMYAKTLEDYFGFKSKEFSRSKLPTILPLELKLSIYGISSLMPGDIFNIDYLPSIYKKHTYFQITKVSHDISTSTWTTSLETVMRIKPNTKGVDFYKNPQKIFLSSSWFGDKVSKGIKELFYNFDLTEKTVGDVYVFTATARKAGTFDWWKTTDNFPKSDKYWFGVYFDKDGAPMKPDTIRGGGNSLVDLRYELLAYFVELLKIEIGESYKLLVFKGGCIPLAYGDGRAYTGGQKPKAGIGEYAKAVDEAIQHSKKYEWFSLLNKKGWYERGSTPMNIR